MKKIKFDQKINDLENKWKRALADYANLERRVEREKEEWADLINAGLILKLLEVLDELELALKHQPNKGVELTLAKLVRVLADQGVREIQGILGEEFRAEAMEAVEVVPGAKGKVAEVVAKGYTINGKVLRPAKVKVGGGQKEAKNE
jgi:molecular chaperone GrpE